MILFVIILLITVLLFICHHVVNRKYVKSNKVVLMDMSMLSFAIGIFFSAVLLAMLCYSFEIKCTSSSKKDALIEEYNDLTNNKDEMILREKIIEYNMDVKMNKENLKNPWISMFISPAYRDVEIIEID